VIEKAGDERPVNGYEQIAADLGVPVFNTDLYMPVYKEGRIGCWRISRVQFGLDHGYHTGVWAIRDMPVLLRSGGASFAWETWMSLSPHEIESQEPGCRHAFGHTVVMGLGMGWVPINVALNPAVSRVNVIEHDPEVIDLFRHSGALDDLAEAVVHKIGIIEADALDWTPGRRVDFLYADIWRALAEPGTLDQVRRMAGNAAAGRIYYWGQELAIYSEAKRLLAPGERLSDTHIRRCIEEEIALPLLIPPGVDYAAMIERVVENRRARNLPGV
jgi:hypothetical protein